MNPEAFLRQLDLLDPAQYQDRPITIVGAGGIGASTTVALAKTGFRKLTVYDFDTIEEHNYPNQLLPMFMESDNPDDMISSIGVPKVVALQQLVWNLCAVAIDEKAEKYTNQPLGEIVVVGVDSLKARREIWSSIEQSMDTLFVVDGRMAITSMDLYAVDMMDEESVSFYVKSLEGEDVEQSCTSRATMFNSFIIAGEIALLVAAFVSDWPNVPRRFYYNLRSWKTLPQYHEGE